MRFHPIQPEVTPLALGEWIGPPIQGGASNHPQNRIPHTARRSFCSNEYLRGTDPLVIMAMSGHSSHKSFMRYIKVSNEQFADKLEQIWAERG